MAALGCAVATTALASRGESAPDAAATRARAYNASYNLDYEESVAAFREAIAADGNDAAAWRGLAAVSWLRVMFLRGTLTVDDFTGAISSSEVKLPPPPPDLDRQFKESINRALAIAERRLAANPNDAGAHFDVGAALGLLASYTGSVDGKLFAGFRAARRAFSEQEDALERDPSRKDAGLIIGTYRYAVSTLAAPVRWMAYIVGFGGGRERGVQLVEQCAWFPSESQVDAKVALVLLYNREGRPADALRMIDQVRRQFPRNRLFWIEHGATAIRAGRFAEAEAILSEGMARFEDDRRVRIPGEQALWLYKRGLARVLQGKAKEAEADLGDAMAHSPKLWVLGRIHTELGRIADLAGDRTRALREYNTAISMCGRSNDPDGVNEAKRWRDRPFTRPPLGPAPDSGVPPK